MKKPAMFDCGCSAAKVEAGRCDVYNEHGDVRSKVAGESFQLPKSNPFPIDYYERVYRVSVVLRKHCSDAEITGGIVLSEKHQQRLVLMLVAGCARGVLEAELTTHPAFHATCAELKLSSSMGAAMVSHVRGVL